MRLEQEKERQLEEERKLKEEKEKILKAVYEKFKEQDLFLKHLGEDL